jgi:hypothetical protein
MKAAMLLKALMIMWGAILLAGSGPSRALTTGNAPAALLVSCSAPRDNEELRQCAAWERRILDATVLLDFTIRCGDKGMPHVPSHATVVDDHTLLTHDHFDPLADPQCTVGSLEIASARGHRYPLITDAVLLEQLAQHLRPNATGSNYQARLLRFPSSLFRSVPDLRLETFDDLARVDALALWGEVADVDWRWLPGTTRVQWVRPLRIEQRGAALGLVVDRAVEVGASGGGVFRVTPGGLVHVGNIWGTWHDDDTSIIALNRAAALER